MNKIWRIKEPNHSLGRSLTETLRISPITAQLLINRGITDEMQAHHFLYGDITSCHDPSLLKDLERSVIRIKRAAENKENILLYGDYDVDGITGVALLSRTLTFLGVKHATHIPNRLEEGYGLNPDAVRSAHAQKTALIITVDCGICGNKEVDLANSLGMDVIITDHHEIKGRALPKAYAIINPLQENCRYPFKYLAGVGLAYKLAQGLLRNTSFPVEEHLDLVALGTVSDLSAQQGENRILTRCGLRKLKETKKAGIKALIDVCRLKEKVITSGHIGFILGPRINAMGRTGSPGVALKLLLTEDRDEADVLAGIMDKANRTRQKIERGVLEEAMEAVKREVNFKESRVIVLSKAGWHPGVIGIVASRIVDKYYRPTVMISLDGPKGKGSARSIDNFHLFDAIAACREHLIDFGGHEAACGLAIDKENVPRFTEAINLFAKTAIKEDDLYPTVDIDAEVELSELSEKLVEELALMEPFGQGNPKPVLSSRDLYLKNDSRRIAKRGVKMWVTNDKITCEAVSFRAESMGLPLKGTKVSLVYSPSINTWQGVSSLQLDLRDLKVL